ncbi:MAG TPA: hypothetical protein VL523_11200 [Terriglobia bacterium]|nr:hypothetical protein [Terriglobia bacterium]
MFVFNMLTASDEFKKWNINVFNQLTGSFVTFFIFARAYLRSCFLGLRASASPEPTSYFEAC